MKTRFWVLVFLVTTIVMHTENYHRLKKIEKEIVEVKMEDATPQHYEVEVELEELQESLVKMSAQELLDVIDFDLLLEYTAQVESDNRNVGPRKVCYSKGDCTIVRGKYQIEDRTANWIKRQYKVSTDKDIAKSLYVHRLHHESWRLEDDRANWECKYFVVYKAFFNSYRGATTFERWEKSKKIVDKRRAKNG
jgi:hypothetical protein